MHAIRRPRPTGALLALVFCLALVGPGAAGRAATGAGTPGSLAGPAAGLEQGMLRDLAGQSLVTPGGPREGRDRPGPAPAGVLAAGLAAVGARAAAARRPGRPARRRAAAPAGARAPPSPRPAPI
jgi:hypothetical protein